ncbi:phage tail protein [Photobacterium sp. 1_MG-2023]|uniref:phage tail protein n=1 Tax=Photobacterium sp. 1_MG-2023 TaxID=3062646 RepID=UPI0026E2113E|nr:phage tail protein [Photobacterium sp. 1_MG-2023]MDO6708351.1 phage tail protein [Photobacterium sp. 1_MG-2023]
MIKLPHIQTSASAQAAPLRGLIVPEPPEHPSPGQLTTLGMPVGSVIAFAGEISQQPGPHQTNLMMFDWLLCDGTLVNIAQYPELFGALGVRYGGNESQGQFQLPDYQGTFLRGVDSQNKQSGSTENRTAPAGGNASEVGSTQDYAMREHQHNYQFRQTGTATPTDPPTAFTLSATTLAKQTTDHPDVAAVNVSSNETRPVNTFVYWLIKARPDRH